jgi:D-alanyl-D-alanine dipeptidase
MLLSLLLTFAVVAQDKPQAKVELSASDVLKVREIQLRITAAKLAQLQAQKDEQAALIELQKVAQDIQQRLGCALREADDKRLICVKDKEK